MINKKDKFPNDFCYGYGHASGSGEENNSGFTYNNDGNAFSDGHGYSDNIGLGFGTGDGAGTWSQECEGYGSLFELENGAGYGCGIDSNHE